MSGTDVVDAPRDERRGRRTRLAFRLAAAPFAALTAFFGAQFAAGLAAREVRTGLLLYIFFTAAAAIGLALVRAWGRAFGLIVAIGNAGLGALSLLAVILSGDGRALGPAALTVVSIVLAYTLTLRVFTLPGER
jgi:hypothetical protein